MPKITKRQIFHPWNLFTDHDMGEAHQLICAVQLRDKPIGELEKSGLKKSEIPEFMKEVEQYVRICNNMHTGKPKLKCFFRLARARGCVYGFYIYPWALEAFDMIHSAPIMRKAPQQHWLLGLLYGYSPGSIQAWLDMIKQESRGRKKVH